MYYTKQIPIKLPQTKQFRHQTISNQFFREFDAWTKPKNQIINLEKKSNVKTESTQQGREIWRVLDSEYATTEANNLLRSEE